MVTLKMAAHTLLLYSVGFLIRYFLTSQPNFREWISSKVEVNTPLNSWKRVQDGVYMQQNVRLPAAVHSTSPHEGDIFHETPLALFIFKHLINYVESWIPLMFIIMDIVTAVLVSKASKHTINYLIEKQHEDSSYISSKSSKILMKEENLYRIPAFVSLVYLLNPLGITNCAAMTTTVVTNYFHAWTFYLMMSGSIYSSVLMLGLATYQSLYSVILVLPIILICSQQKKQSLTRSAVKVLTLLSAELTVLLLLSFVLMNNSWLFLEATYGFILQVPDLTPNIGLFWYFMMENFDHFSPFFLFVFQVNVFIYMIPLGFRFRRCPPFLFVMLLITMTITKSYPCVGDIALYMAVIPNFSHLAPYMRNVFVSGCVLLCATILTPVMWHLWIYQGSANANFYFASTLIINGGQVFFVGDVLIAYIRYEYDLINGPKKKDTTLYLS